MRSYFITNEQYNKDGSRIQDKFVNATGNEIVLYFKDPLRLDPTKKYEVSVLRAAIVYCVSNISSALGNNKLTFTYIDNITHNLESRTYTFDDGLYSLDNINFKLSLFTSQMNNSQNDNLIYFVPDESTSKIYVTFPTETNVTVDASATNSILISLGFTTSQGSAGDGIIGNFSNIAEYEISTNKAQLNPIQNYLLATNISTGNYFDGSASNVIESIPIGKTSAGSLTEFDSNNKSRSLVTINNIDRLIITLLDNYGNDVDLTGGKLENPETFSVEICISEKK